MNIRKAILASLVLAATSSQASQLYDNGAVVGLNGLSVLTPPAGYLGVQSNLNPAVSLADNFVVAGSPWTVESFDFYAYQLGGGGFPFTAAVWTVLGGASNINNATVIASGFSAASDGGLIGYRVASATPNDTSRPIYRVHVDVPDFQLAQGSYWLTWSLAGVGTSAPLVPPVMNSLGTGNGMQKSSGATSYALLFDAGSQQTLEFPFSVNGTVSAVPEPAPAASLTLGLFGLAVAVVRRRAAADASACAS